MSVRILPRTPSEHERRARAGWIFQLPVVSRGAGLVTVVGMFYGANRRDLIRGVIDYAMSRAALVAVCAGALFYVLAPQLIGVFADAASIVQTGAGYLRIGVFAYPFLAIVMLSGRALQGMGQGPPVLVLSVLRVVLISGPLAYMFVLEMGKPVEWVWIAILSGTVITAMIAGVWLMRALAVSDAGDVAVAATAPLPEG